jgi:hypothetical protein
MPFAIPTSKAEGGTAGKCDGTKEKRKTEPGINLARCD